MKVAFYLSRISYGGGERVIVALITELVKQGIDVVCFTWNQSLISQPFPCRLVWFGDKIPNGSFLRPFGKFLAVKRTIREEGISVFVSFGNEPYVTAACYCEQIRLVFSLRVDPRELPTSLGQRMTYSFLLHTAQTVVFQTDMVKVFYGETVRKKSVVIPNPILDELIPPANHRINKIAAVGRLMPQKNFDLLLDAAHECDLKDFTIHIYGVGELEQHLKDKVKAYHLEEQVVFEGFVPRTIESIKDSSIFVLSSDSEGMPNALIEAMAMGIASIATDVPSGGSRYLIKDGENGILIPVGDKDALVHALQRLIDDEPLRQRLAQRALEVRDRLEKSAIINRWVDLLCDGSNVPSL